MQEDNKTEDLPTSKAQSDALTESYVLEIAKFIVSGLIVSSPRIDRFVTWMMASVAAICIFVADHLDVLVAIAGKKIVIADLWIVIAMLIVTAWEKWNAFSIDLLLISKKQSKDAELRTYDDYKKAYQALRDNALKDGVELAAPLTADRVIVLGINTSMKGLPSWVRKEMWKLIASGLTKPLDSEYKAIHKWAMQLISILLMFALLIALVTTTLVGMISASI